jgi:ADP-heptose:LPS heptosyltransferase
MSYLDILHRIFSMTRDLRAVRKILVCLRYGIGDVVMETPVLAAIRSTLPRGVWIEGLGARPAIELLENDPVFDKLVCVHDFGLRHWGDRGTPKIRSSVGEWLEGERFDAVLSVAHAVAAVREVARERGSVILDAGPQCESDALEAGASGLSAMKRAAREGFGVDVPADSMPRIRLDASDIAFAERFFRERGWDESVAAAGVSPVASSHLKQWPVERFAAVADFLTETMELPVLVFCGPQADSAASLLSAMRNRSRASLVGSLHLRSVAALLARCAFFLCNDTGLMHMAAAVGAPVLALFGPTSPDIYLPPFPNARAFDSLDVECAYRKLHAFGPPECVIANRCLVSGRSCIDRIEEGRVMEALEDAFLMVGQVLRSRI